VKRKINIELLEEHEKVHFYTLRYDNEETEFDKFLDAFPDEAGFKDDIDIIIRWIDKIGKVGANERFYRPEGKYHDSVFAIPIDSCNLRLYILHLNDEIVILGNGGKKTTETYNEDQTLDGIVKLLQSVEKMLRARINKNIVQLYNKTIYGNVSFYVVIK